MIRQSGSSLLKGFTTGRTCVNKSASAVRLVKSKAADAGLKRALRKHRGSRLEYAHLIKVPALDSEKNGRAVPTVGLCASSPRRIARHRAVPCEGGDIHSLTLDVNVARGNLDCARDRIKAGFHEDFPPVAGSALMVPCNVVKSPFDGSGLTTNVDSYRSIGL